jgi:hypothetical protein
MALLVFRVVRSGRYAETWEVMAGDGADAVRRIKASEGNWIDAEWQGEPVYAVQCVTAEEAAVRQAVAAARGETAQDPIHRSHQTEMRQEGGFLVERCKLCKEDSIAGLFRACRGVPG